MSRNSINYPTWVRRSHSISDYKKGDYVYIHTGDPYTDVCLYTVVRTARSIDFVRLLREFNAYRLSGRSPSRRLELALRTIRYKIRDGFLIVKKVEENHV